ncbi:hypothetical protein BGZ46_007751 [Entomortierella lignicola]|nr:hypothetical protein BGZ46_007751 [Entomortierella lignicola]
MVNVEIYRAKVEELIREADITTVSARKIRKEIESITNTSLDNVKREFDELVMEIYEKVSDEIERNEHTKKRQNTSIQNTSSAPQGFQFALPPTSFVAPPPPAVNDSDDDDGNSSEGSYSSVEDGRRSKKAKTSSKSSVGKQAKEKTKSKKSKDKVETKKKSKDKDKPKKERKKPLNEDGTVKQNPFNRPYIISDTLYNVIGDRGTIGPSGKVEMSRPEVVKHMWAYIKENNLQLESDKREIRCDEKLKSIFGQDQINCFSMNKYYGAHFIKTDESPNGAAKPMVIPQPTNNSESVYDIIGDSGTTGPSGKMEETMDI